MYIDFRQMSVNEVIVNLLCFFPSLACCSFLTMLLAEHQIMCVLNTTHSDVMT